MMPLHQRRNSISAVWVWRQLTDPLVYNLPLLSNKTRSEEVKLRWPAVFPAVPLRRSTLSSRPCSSEHGPDLITKRHDNDPIHVKSFTPAIQ